MKNKTFWFSIMFRLYLSTDFLFYYILTSTILQSKTYSQKEKKNCLMIISMSKQLLH